MSQAGPRAVLAGRIASGSIDGTVRVWDVRTGESLRVLEGHGGHVFAVAFSPDGVRIASGSRSPPLLLWESRLEDARGPWGFLPVQVAASQLGRDLYSEGLLQEQVMASLRSDASLSDELRRTAPHLAPFEALSARQLNVRAWRMVDPDREDRATDVALALRIARSAAKLDRSPGYLDTLAWALFANGQCDEALETCEEALELSLATEPDVSDAGPLGAALHDEWRDRHSAHQEYLERMRAEVDRARGR